MMMMMLMLMLMLLVVVVVDHSIRLLEEVFGIKFSSHSRCTNFKNMLMGTCGQDLDRPKFSLHFVTV